MHSKLCLGCIFLFKDQKVFVIKPFSCYNYEQHFVPEFRL